MENILNGLDLEGLCMTTHSKVTHRHYESVVFEYLDSHTMRIINRIGRVDRGRDISIVITERGIRDVIGRETKHIDRVNVTSSNEIYAVINEAYRSTKLYKIVIKDKLSKFIGDVQ